MIFDIFLDIALDIVFRYRYLQIFTPDSFFEIASDCFINAGPQLNEVSAAVAAAVGKECHSI